MVAVVLGQSECVTGDVRVCVRSEYQPQRSNPILHDYLFAYEVTITNEGDQPVRLLTRRWVITDAAGRTEEVEGVGVIGETPVILPNASHRYHSFCPLRTPFGSMEGSYGMVRPDGSTFRIGVAAWNMAVPTAIN